MESTKSINKIHLYENYGKLLKPDEIEKLSPHEVENKLSKKTVGSTIIGLVLVGSFITWFAYALRGYLRWYKYHKLGDHSMIKAGDPVPSLPDTTIVTVGIPLFIVSIMIEWILSILMGYYENYRLADTITSFSNGLLQQFVETFTNILGFYLGFQLLTGIPYRWIYENYGITRAFEGNVLGFIVMWFGRDFCYYWFHRAAHRSAFLWAVHSVHHSPNEFNYSVNLCQGAIQRITSVLFYAPLALFCPPELYQIIFPMEKIYGFMTHTRLVNNMYFISYFFVTPSTHRVHHAGAPSKYIDKNYGEMLTIWDRLFGTHQDEEEPIVYGHVHPIDTWNPIEVQLRVWKEIMKKTEKCTSFVDKILCFIMPPGWDPETRGEYPLSDTTPYSALKYDSHIPWFLSFYSFIWFVINIGTGIILVTFPSKIPNIVLYSLTLFIVYSLFTNGCLLDRNPRAVVYEIIKLLLMPLFVYLTLVNIDFGVPILQATFVLSLFSVLCIFIVIAHNGLFVKETELERSSRVWIREVGREFTSSLNKYK